MGGLNPHSKKVKCFNIISQQEFLFNSIKEAQIALNIPRHDIISKRCNHNLHCLYNNEWDFAYQGEDYQNIKTNKCVSTKTDECKSVG